MTAFAAALASVGTPLSPGVYHVREVLGHPAFYAGRDALGTATLLIRTPNAGRTVPLKLAGIEARFSVPCHIAEPGGNARTESLTAVMCLSHEPEVEGYFSKVIDLLVGVLSPAPTSSAVVSAINDLVDLFQKLKRPPRKPIVGLVGELLVIEAARDTATAISAWRMDNDERYDFASENLRVEAKASSTRKRVHYLSAEQAEPPPESVGLLASICIEQAGGGVSLAQLMDGIEVRLANHTDVIRLRGIVADTLGSDLPSALEWAFDHAAARASLAWFNLRAVPAVRGPAPAGMSAIRFMTDLSACRAADASDVRDVSALARPLLPF